MFKFYTKCNKACLDASRQDASRCSWLGSVTRMGVPAEWQSDLELEQITWVATREVGLVGTGLWIASVMLNLQILARKFIMRCHFTWQGKSGIEIMHHSHEECATWTINNNILRLHVPKLPPQSLVAFVKTLRLYLHLSHNWGIHWKSLKIGNIILL